MHQNKEELRVDQQCIKKLYPSNSDDHTGPCLSLKGWEDLNKHRVVQYLTPLDHPRFVALKFNGFKRHYFLFQSPICEKWLNECQIWNFGTL